MQRVARVHTYIMRLIYTIDLHCLSKNHIFGLPEIRLFVVLTLVLVDLELCGHNRYQWVYEI